MGQQALDPTEVEQGVAGVGLLDDARDDVAFAVRVLLELAIAFGFTDLLTHHLTERLGGDAAHLVLARRVVALVHPQTVLVDVVCGELELERIGIDLDDDFLGGTGTTLVGERQRVGEHLEQCVDRDVLLVREHANGFGHVELTHDASCGADEVDAESEGAVSGPAPAGAFLERLGCIVGFGCAGKTNTVFARSIWP